MECGISLYSPSGSLPSSFPVVWVKPGPSRLSSLEKDSSFLTNFSIRNCSMKNFLSLFLSDLFICFEGLTEREKKREGVREERERETFMEHLDGLNAMNV